MAKKHNHKRQKTGKSTVADVQPLGSRTATSLLDNSEKDDEERRLESMLFGTPYVPASRKDVHTRDILVVSDEEQEEDGDELRTVLDKDVSYSHSTSITSN